MSKWKDLNKLKWGDLTRTTWKEVKLGEVVEFIDGDRGKNYPKQNEYLNKGYCLFLNTSNVTKDGFKFDDVNYISKERDSLLRKGRLEYGDLVLTTRGTVGNIALYKEGIYQPARINSSMVIMRVKDCNTFVHFIYYIFKSESLKEHMTSYSSGSAQPQLPIKDLRQIKFQIPDLETQEKIADVLSAYDELIENNNRRIEILEKTVEEIYKEWFVRMRFPGHENTKFEKGIPEGWEVRKVGEIIDKLESGKRPKNIYEEEKMIVSLGAGDVKNLGEYNDSDEYLIPYSFFRGLNRGVVESKDITVYKDGAYTGKVTMFRDDFPYKEMAINEHVFLVRCKDEKLQNYLLFTLKQKSYYELIQALSMTSAQPGINQSKFKNIKVEIPGKELINKFHDISELYLRKIFNLAKQNQNLIKQRDLLLPRLMNGTIEVK